MARADTLWRHLRWDLLALTVLAAVVGGYLVVSDPGFRPAESPRADGSKPPDHTEGDVLLVLPSAPAGEATELSTMDCSFGWFNALRQHFGTFATAGADNISAQMLAGHSVVVVPDRVGSELSGTVREDLEEFARNGGQLILEMPRDQMWSRITGVSVGDQLSEARAITAAEGLDSYGPVRDHLLEVPLAGQRIEAPQLEPRPTGPVVFEVEEQPGLVVRQLDEGTVYVLLFDFACSLIAMNQGMPGEQMEFGGSEGDDLLPTEKRVGHDQLTEGTVPYATVLQRALFDRLHEPRPIARLWPFPGQYMGAAMSVHPAPYNLRAAFAFADRAHRQEAASTILAAGDRLSPDHAALARRIDAQVGLLWVLGQQRPPMAEGVGPGALQPWQRELNLPRQTEQLSDNLEQQASPRVVQTEGTLWETDWDSTFRTLAGAGLEVDTSFGPSDESHYGYLFGGGMPFYPLDLRGRPLPVLELPFAFGGANLTSERLERLLEQSEQQFHQPVVVNLASDSMARNPSVGLLLGFRDFHELSRAHDHWLTTVADFADFLSARRQSVLTSQWSENQRRLTVSANLVGISVATAGEEGAVPTVAVPARYDGADIERIELEGEPVPPEQLATSGPGDERLIELGTGRHVVSVYYGSPDRPDDEES